MQGLWRLVLATFGLNFLINPWKDDAPLDKSTDSFRLITLHPDSRYATIECTLWTTTFADKPSYEALSYTWGEATSEESILLNGKYISVGSNLWSALYHLRTAEHPRTLWVDAICIDQSEIQEKNHQVSLMAFLYERATTVLVWLKPCEKDQGLSRSLISCMVNQEYWKRAWIIQEIGMASRLVVYSGWQNWQWQDFIDIIMAFETQNLTELQHTSIIELHRLRNSRYSTRETYQLCNLLHTFRDSFCKDARDKVYAFLGMASDHNVNQIPIGYQRSIQEIYEDTLSFYSSSAIDSMRKRIDLLHFGALVRLLLTRRSYRRIMPRPRTPFWKAETWRDDTVIEGGLLAYENRNVTQEDYALGLLSAMLFLKVLEYAVRVSIRTFYWLLHGEESVYSMHWHDSANEDVETWKDFLLSANKAKLYYARASKACQITHLGPLYTQIVGSFAATKGWGQFLDSIILENPQSQGTSALRGRNGRLQHLLGDSTKNASKFFDIVNFPSWDSSSLNLHAIRSSEKESPRLFLCDDMSIGLIPPAAEIGDTIVQFWNTNASAVVRIRRDGFPKIIGRAGVVKEGCNIGWDIPRDLDTFSVSTENAIDLSMDLAMLTYLSFNILHLYGG